MSYSHSDVAHEFAHKTGKKQTGSNVFYERDGDFWTIYSYGTHFAIATLLPGDTYGMTALFTQQDYSNSTSKHKSVVRTAISQYSVIEVPENTDRYYRYSDGSYELHVSDSRARKDLEIFRKRAIELVGKQERARKRDYSRQLSNLVANVQKYVDTFNCKPYLTGKLRKAIYNDLSNNEILELYFSKDHLEELAEKRKQEQKRKRRERRRQIQAFHNHERDSVHASTRTYLRLSITGGAIETSKQVTIKNLDKAKALFELAQKAKELRESIDYKGSIANFSVDRITENGTIKAGCHTVPFTESERIAEQKGWI